MKEIALRAGGIPDLGRPVGAGGDQPLGIRREGDSGHAVAVSLESETLLASCWVPNLHDLIQTGSERTPIGAIDDTVYFRIGDGNRGDFLCHPIKDSNRAAATTPRHMLTVWTETDSG